MSVEPEDRLVEMRGANEDELPPGTGNGQMVEEVDVDPRRQVPDVADERPVQRTELTGHSGRGGPVRELASVGYQVDAGEELLHSFGYWLAVGQHHVGP